MVDWALILNFFDSNKQLRVDPKRALNEQSLLNTTGKRFLTYNRIPLGLNSTAENSERWAEPTLNERLFCHFLYRMSVWHPNSKYSYQHSHIVDQNL